MDLISREAVRDGMKKYGFHAPDMTVHEFVEDELPSVPAVPLDALCEWLDGKGGIPCGDCKAVYGKETDRPCCHRLPFECNSKEHWKWFLTKLMDVQHDGSD